MFFVVFIFRGNAVSASVIYEGSVTVRSTIQIHGKIITQASYCLNVLFFKFLFIKKCAMPC